MNNGWVGQLKNQLYERRRHARIVAQRAPAAVARLPRVGYVGGQGYGNLGDDVMFLAARRLLAGKSVVSHCDPAPEQSMSRLGLSGPGFFQSVVLGGGTLISDPAWLWHKQVAYALDRGLPVVSLGTGAGSSGFASADDVGVSTWLPLLRRFERIGVRGPISAETLRASGIPNVEIVGDLALALALDRPAAQTRPKCVAFNIALPAADLKEMPVWVQELARTISALHQSGHEIVPFAMTKADVRTIRSVLGLVNLEGLPVPLLRTWQSFEQSVGSCAITVSVRLHGAVLSNCLGVPALLIGYRGKCMDYMQSMDLQEWHVHPDQNVGGAVLDLVRTIDSRPPEALRTDVLARTRQWQERLRRFVRETPILSAKPPTV